MPLRTLSILILLAVSFLHGCAMNPVTGRQELHIVSEAEEVRIGRENYLPSQQSQGGEYVVDQELTAYVNSVGQKLAKASDRPNLPYEFVVLNNPVPNAWALPGGKIAVNRGLLLALDNEAELAAVLGHEIVHAAARHGAKAMERGMLMQVGMIGIGIAFSDHEYSDLIVGGAGLGAALIATKYSRDQELESDQYGMKYMARAGYDPRAAIELQKTFIKLSEDKEPGWLNGLFASHPPSRERVDANLETARTFPEGGASGKEEYQAKLAGLVKSKPAYEALEKGQKALAKSAFSEAWDLARDAISIEPHEALFHELQADVKTKGKEFNEALQYYDKSIEEKGRFFRFFLKRGLVKEKLGDFSGARSDLEKSNSLLPTALAHNALGNIALAGGQAAQAMEHFRMAAGSGSEAGRSARISLARLELPGNPGKYLDVGFSVSGAGSVIVNLRNNSGASVQNVAVAVALMGKGGFPIAQDTVVFRRPIPPGAVSSIASLIGPIKDENQFRRLRSRIMAAQIAD